MSDAGPFVLRWRGRESGPFSLAEINRKLDDHEIGMGHEIQSGDQWISLEEFFARSKPEPVPVAAAQSRRQEEAQASSEISACLPALAATMPPSSDPAGFAMKNPPAAPLRPRRRLVYALLGILFGFAGVHNYYARHWMTGLLQLLLSVATSLLGFGIIAPWLWAMVETFAVRKDGGGHEML